MFSSLYGVERGQNIGSQLTITRYSGHEPGSALLGVVAWF